MEVGELARPCQCVVVSYPWYLFLGGCQQIGQHSSRDLTFRIAFVDFVVHAGCVRLLD